MLIDRFRWGVASLSSGEPAVGYAFDAFVAPTASARSTTYHAMGMAEPFSGMDGCGTDLWQAGCSELRAGGSPARPAMGSTSAPSTRTTTWSASASGQQHRGHDLRLLAGVGHLGGRGWNRALRWNPVSLRLTKVELATGRSIVADDPTAKRRPVRADWRLARAARRRQDDASSPPSLYPRMAAARTRWAWLRPPPTRQTSCVGITVVDTSIDEGAGNGRPPRTTTRSHRAPTGAWCSLLLGRPAGSQPTGRVDHRARGTTGTPPRRSAGSASSPSSSRAAATVGRRRAPSRRRSSGPRVPR